MEIKDSGKRQEFDTGAVRDTSEDKGRYDLLPAFAIERLARHFEAGAKKYKEENWRKGIPLRRYLDSALRHTFKFLEGQRDEDHAIAAAWNLLAMVETSGMIARGILPASLDNLPSFIGGEQPSGYDDYEPGNPFPLDAEAAYEAKAKQVYGDNLYRDFIDEGSLRAAASVYPQGTGFIIVRDDELIPGPQEIADKPVEPADFGLVASVTEQRDALAVSLAALVDSLDGYAFTDPDIEQAIDSGAATLASVQEKQGRIHPDADIGLEKLAQDVLKNDGYPWFTKQHLALDGHPIPYATVPFIPPPPERPGLLRRLWTWFKNN